MKVNSSSKGKNTSPSKKVFNVLNTPLEEINAVGDATQGSAGGRGELLSGSLLMACFNSVIPGFLMAAASFGLTKPTRRKKTNSDFENEDEEKY